MIMITTLVYETVMPAALAMYGAMDELAMDEMSSGGSGGSAFSIAVYAVVMAMVIIGGLFHGCHGWEYSKNWFVKILGWTSVVFLFAAIFVAMTAQVLVLAYMFWPITILVAILYFVYGVNWLRERIRRKREGVPSWAA